MLPPPQRLWERYFRRLVGLARRKLQDTPRRVADEEDVALSAFASFCRGAEAGCFPQLADRDNLWHLLVTLTERKVYHQVRDERCQKRRAAASASAWVASSRSVRAAQGGASSGLP